MSKWLNDDVVLVGQGSGEAIPVSPRLRSLSSGSPRMGRGRTPPASPRTKETPLSLREETMDKAKELFVLCDKEGKGFITKQDMQRLQEELPLSPEQLETVFESLDRESNGYLTPAEFNTGLGDLMGLEETTEPSLDEEEQDGDEMDWSQDPTVLRFVNILTELGADKLFKDQQELCSLWCELQTDRPELLSALEGILCHVVSHLQDTIRERDSLEQALRRRESEHDQIVRSIYEEMENQIREEKEKWLAQESLKEKLRGRQLEEELKVQEQQLENTLMKQKELETRVRQLSRERVNINEQNQQLRSLNAQLQQQVESSREQLQAALTQVNTLHNNAAQEQVTRQRNVMKVSRNMKKEKDSLLKQLEILRDMNRMLRDERDAQQSQQRNPNVTKPLVKKGSIIGNYLLRDEPVKRRLSSSDELKLEKKKEVTLSSNRHQLSCRVRGESVQSKHTQQVFKVVFLGNSGVGKSSFIQHCCSGRFNSQTSSTVDRKPNYLVYYRHHEALRNISLEFCCSKGIDFRMKTLTLGFTTITLQLWDTAGQERYRSITEQYYRKADGILTMYDITDSASFTAVRGWMDTVKEKMCEGTVLMLLGNKLDLTDGHSRKVTTTEGQRLAEQYQALFHECSAKTGHNVDQLMTHLAGMLVTRHDRQCEDAVLLTEDTPRRGCCAYNKK